MDTLQNFFALPQDATLFTIVIMVIKKAIALIGVFIIFWGACEAVYFFVGHWLKPNRKETSLDVIRLRFGRSIILGLEFIVAADVIETTTAPDYYSIGILASLVAIRTFLSYFMNRELRVISKKN